MKKIMLLGGSGALGSYLTPELLKMGYKVHVVSLDDLKSDNENLTYEQANVKDDAWLKDALKENYDEDYYRINVLGEFGDYASGLVVKGCSDKNIMHFQMDMANLEISGLEHNQLIMEVSGEYEGNAPTLNEKRRSVSSAQHFCSIMDDILDDLEYEYGVIFGRVLAERPSEETIVMKKKEINIHSKAYRTEKKVMKDTLY